MSLNHPKSGLGFVPEYQVSSWPFLTSSIVDNELKIIDFPGVTRWIVVHNEGHSSSKVIKIGFTENAFKAANSNVFVVHAGEMTPRLELKCNKLFISSSDNSVPFSLFAGYTGIKNDQFPVLTSSNGFLGVG
jgi:hypothetical protein